MSEEQWNAIVVRNKERFLQEGEIKKRKLAVDREVIRNQLAGQVELKKKIAHEEKAQDVSNF